MTGVQTCALPIYVLFPKNKVSQLQEKQLTCVAENVWPIEIEGYFDDCQAMVKQAFNDPDLQPLNLTSANSINLGRLIPQIITTYGFGHNCRKVSCNWSFLQAILAT